MQKTAIKGLGFTLLFFPSFIFSQPIIHPPKKDYSETFEHIAHGDLMYYLDDNVTVVKEKTCNRWIISELPSERACRKFQKIIKDKSIVYDKNSSSFDVYVWEDQTLKHKVTFGINPSNSKINRIEISKEN